ncbi:uncharacterized protein [Typha latifolia]|uniref:uncharacterized protein n=1 Tax=Typha latifolia TaxID=4733 RepID=UPI003C2C32A5
METSQANRLPEAHSLPDGFVESSAELSTTAEPLPSPDDYKGSLLDVDLDLDRRGGEPESNGGTTETLDSESIAVGLEKLSTSADPLREKKGGGGSAEETILVTEPGADRREEAKDAISTQGGGISGETKGCLESQTGKLPERPTVEHAEYLKNQTESSEPKRKVVKRSTKSEKEILEFTLKYQKVIAERDAAVAVRERLESLCRELQRQNKVLMDECQRVSTEGQNMRLELSTKFNNAIKDVSSKLEEQKNECLSQLRENEMLRDKLKHLADQYTLAEQQFSQKLKQKMLELELADLKLQQHQERSTQEQTQMQLYAEQISQLMATEKSLRLQLVADGEKFQQFQEALSKSNEVFETFKHEMEKMTKLIKELKKENEFLKSKCENSDIALVKLIEERELMKMQLEKVKNQKEKLESLCRSLQAERKQSIVGSSSIDAVSIQVGSVKD